MCPPCSSSTSTCSSAWLHSSQTGRLRPGERPPCHPALKASGLFPKPCPRSPAWCPPPAGREGGRKEVTAWKDDEFDDVFSQRCSIFFVSEMNGWLMMLLARGHPGGVYLFHLGLRLLKPAVAGGIGRGWRCTAGTICTRSSWSSGGSSWGRIWCRPSRKLTSKLKTGIW